MSITNWHAGRDNPVRKGVYQRSIMGEIVWTYWDGEGWSCSWHNKKDAECCRIRGYYQREPWRGIEK